MTKLRLKVVNSYYNYDIPHRYRSVRQFAESFFFLTHPSAINEFSYILHSAVRNPWTLSREHHKKADNPNSVNTDLSKKQSQLFKISSKQCRPRSDAAFRGVWSWSTRFASGLSVKSKHSVWCFSWAILNNILIFFSCFFCQVSICY